VEEKERQRAETEKEAGRQRVEREMEAEKERALLARKYRWKQQCRIKPEQTEKGTRKESESLSFSQKG